MKMNVHDRKTRPYIPLMVCGTLFAIVFLLIASLPDGGTNAQAKVPVSESKGSTAPLVGGGRIAFASMRDGQNRPDIYTMNPDGTGVVRLTTDPTFDQFPDWSHDGSKIAFSSSRDHPTTNQNEIYVMNADGSGQHIVATGMVQNVEPSWSPDGSKIAFLGYPTGSPWPDIHVMNANGSGLTRLTFTTNGCYPDAPSWSPNGSTIAFDMPDCPAEGGTDGIDGGTHSIYIINATGGTPVSITSGENAFDPAWSPDGASIAFSKYDNTGSHFDLWKMSSIGGGETFVTSAVGNINLAASWSPDGQRIVFSDRDPGASSANLYVVDASGANKHDISGSSTSDVLPDWGNVSTTMILVQGEDGFPVEGAQVYNECNLLGTTNVSGTLALTTSLALYDRLIARKQVYEAPTQKGGHDGWAYRVWLTNIIQENDGSETMFVVTDTEQPTQTIVISSTNAQIGFNIVASVEYNDTAAHLDEIAQGFFGANLFLMDVTDGQMYFEQVKLYDDKQLYDDADFQFQLEDPRANADIAPDGVSALTSTDKHIRMASPDHYGTPYNQESAFTVLVHEFGHYAIGADDEYYKFNIDDYPTQCTADFPAGDYDDRASIMYHQNESSEFCATIPPIVHNPDTAQGYIQGESVWQTLVDNYSDEQGLWQLRSPMTRHVVDSGPPSAFCLGQYGATAQTFNAPGPTCDRPVQVHAQFASGQPAIAAWVSLGHNNRWITERDTDAGGDSYVLGVSTGDTIHVTVYQGGNYSGDATVANCDDLITITLAPTLAPASVEAPEAALEGRSQAIQSPDVWPAYWLEAVPDWTQDAITATLHVGADPPGQPTLLASQDTLNRQPITLTYNASLHEYTGVYTFDPTISPDFLFELELPTGSGTALSTFNFNAGQYHANGPSGYEKMKNLGEPHGNNPQVPPIAWNILRPEGQVGVIVNTASLPDGTGVMVGTSGMPADKPSNFVPVGGPYSIQGQNPISGEIGITLAYQSEYFCGLVPGSAAIYEYTGSGWTAIPTSLIDEWHQAGGKITTWGIYAVFAQPNPRVLFSDVPQGSTFYDYINWMTCHGIVSGYADGTFRPNNNATRGQISKMVANAFNWRLDPPVGGGYTFTDVPPGSTFFSYVEAVYRQGVVSGYPCGGAGEACDPQQRPYFRPSRNVTRGQIAKIISNAAHYDDTPVGQSFQDVAPGSTFYTYTQRIASRSIINGYPCGGAGEPCVPPTNRSYFRPSANATRGQLSKIIYLALVPR